MSFDDGHPEHHVLTGPLTLHRVASDGTVGEPVGPVRVVTTTAALLEPAPDPDTGEVDPLPDPAHPDEAPTLPLLLVDGDDHAVRVLEVHTSPRTRAVALEVEHPVLTVDEPDDEDPEHPGRSVWCQIFPRMRGCR